MIDWSVKTWHRRLNQWTYGEEMFYSTFQSWDEAGHSMLGKHAKQINLCPYMRRLVIAIVGLPFLFVFRALDHKVVAQVTFIAVVVNLIIAGVISLPLRISYLAALEATVIATLISLGGFGLLVGLYELKDKLHERAERKERERWEAENKALREGTYKPKGPNPLRAFLHAKHEKVCPQITWVEEKPTEPTPTVAPSTSPAPENPSNAN